MPKTAIIIAHLALKTAVLIAHEVSPVVGPGVDVCPGVAQEWMSAQEWPSSGGQPRRWPSGYGQPAARAGRGVK